MRPSCGRRFSAMSMRHIVLRREVMARLTSFGTRWISCSTPSMRKRITAFSRSGSMWMSLARETQRVPKEEVDGVDDVRVAGLDLRARLQLHILLEVADEGEAVAAQVELGLRHRGAEA